MFFLASTIEMKCVFQSKMEYKLSYSGRLARVISCITNETQKKKLLSSLCNIKSICYKRNKVTNPLTGINICQEIGALQQYLYGDPSSRSRQIQSRIENGRFLLNLLYSVLFKDPLGIIQRSIEIPSVLFYQTPIIAWVDKGR